jgi:hypothetical protein
MLCGSAGVAGAYDAVFVGEDGDLYAVAQLESGEDAGDVAFDGCLAEVEPGRDLGVRQPASRFWPFQWIEGGWLLALSALLIAATIWLVRRRAA